MKRNGFAVNACRKILPAALILVAIPCALAAQDSIEEQAKRQRQGAGLRVGWWMVQGLSEHEDESHSPFFEGYFQRGLDLHLAIESSIGVWRRHTETEVSVIGGSDTRTADTYLVPLFTGIRFFPFTRPGATAEPYVTGGVGFALGIQDVDEPDNIIGGGGGTGMVTGFGFKAGAGLEWRFARAMALDVAAHYHWIRFGAEMSGDRTFKGPGVDLGLSYRFQYE